MTRLSGFGRRSGAAIAVTFVLGSCGDNAIPCGEGTTEVDGLCTAPPPVTCGEGTKPTNGECVLDPAICQAGTVLIADRCVDPTHGLVIDLEESAEPNGSAVAPGVEPSPAPAGAFSPKPAGMPFVVHGHLTPFRDRDGDGQLDPDVDTYVITVDAPTLLAISVAGVGGAHGAFYATALLPGPPARRYERYGLSLTGDTAHRRLLLPAAGAYQLAITDARALAIGDHPPPAAGRGGPAGGPDAEYYAAITAEPLPAPTAIPVTAGSGTLTAALTTDEVQLFTAPLGTGTSQIRDAMPGPGVASLIVLDSAALVGYADEDPGPPQVPATVTLDFHGAAATPVIAADAVYNTGPAPEPFTLTVTVN